MTCCTQQEWDQHQASRDQHQAARDQAQAALPGLQQAVTDAQAALSAGYNTWMMEGYQYQYEVNWLADHEVCP